MAPPSGNAYGKPRKTVSFSEESNKIKQFTQEEDPFSDVTLSLGLQDFESFLKQKDIVVVLFHEETEGCSESKIIDEFNAAAETSITEDVFAHVDCRDERKLCDKENITKTPVYKIYKRSRPKGSIREPFGLSYNKILSIIPSSVAPLSTLRDYSLESGELLSSMDEKRKEASRSIGSKLNRDLASKYSEIPSPVLPRSNETPRATGKENQERLTSQCSKVSSPLLPKSNEAARAIGSRINRDFKSKYSEIPSPVLPRSNETPRAIEKENQVRLTSHYSKVPSPLLPKSNEAARSIGSKVNRDIASEDSDPEKVRSNYVASIVNKINENRQPWC